MWSSIKAGAAYFALVFALGFVLGTLRVFLLAPALGDLGAVLVELPMMLVASWLICHWLTRLLRVPSDMPARLVMGGSAFVFLIVAEISLSLWLFGNSIAAHFGNYGTAHGAAGLAGQIAFAAFPVVQLGRRGSPGRR